MSVVSRIWRCYKRRGCLARRRERVIQCALRRVADLPILSDYLPEPFLAVRAWRTGRECSNDCRSPSAETAARLGDGP